MKWQRHESIKLRAWNLLQDPYNTTDIQVSPLYIWYLSWFKSVNAESEYKTLNRYLCSIDMSRPIHRTFVWCSSSLWGLLCSTMYISIPGHRNRPCQISFVVRCILQSQVTETVPNRYSSYFDGYCNRRPPKPSLPGILRISMYISIPGHLIHRDKCFLQADDLKSSPVAPISKYNPKTHQLLVPPPLQ